MTEITTLQKLNSITEAIIKVQTIDEGLECYSRIKAIKEYVRSKKLGKDLQDELMVCDLRAECRNGQILREMAKKGEIRTADDGLSRKKALPQVIPSSLEDYNINLKQSHQWQLLTWIPDERFEQEIVKRRGKESSIAKKDFYDLGKKYKKPEIEEIIRNIGEASLITEDAVKFLNSFEDESIDLLLTDPPYMTDIEEPIFDFAKRWVPLALSKLKSTGRAYVFTGSYPKEIYAYLSILFSIKNINFEDILVWFYRNTLGPSPKMNYKRNWHVIFHLYKKDALPLSFSEKTGMLEQFMVQEINAPDGRHEIRYSSFQKPLDLAEQLIRHSSKEKDTVIDPFAGTGTFLLAAKYGGCIAYGADINKEMIKVFEGRDRKMMGVIKNEL